MAEVAAPADLSSLESGVTSGDDVLMARKGSSGIAVSARSWLRCDKLSFSVGKKVHILHEIDCVLPPGRLVALMGPSGAGKTTLLNCLSARTLGVLKGELTMNGKKVTRALMKRNSKLVPQDDILNPVLTAREMLTFTARLAMAVPAAVRAARVQEVLETLSLTDCADVVIGGETVKGLSGGQRKRVSIGIELLSNPSILFLDEPTSGLDSKVAEDVVSLIAGLAQAGRTVVCTIHQPSFRVLQAFSTVLLLDKGRVAFDGPVDALPAYLSAIGSPCPEFVNPADHMMNVLSQPVPDGYQSYHEVFAASEAAKDADDEAERQQRLCDAFVARSGGAGRDKLATRGAADSEGSGYAVSYWSQARVLAARAMTITFKDKRQFRLRIVQLVFIGTIIGTIFFQMPFTQARVQDRISCLFLCMLFLSMTSLMSTAMVVIGERALVNREISNNLFAPGAYFVGRLSVLLLLQVVYTLIFASAIYFLIGLRPGAESFFLFLLMLCLLALITGSMGYGVGLAFPSMEGVSATVPMVIMPLTLFAGLFIALPNIPDYWLWLYYISPFSYSLNSLVVVEFQDRDFEPCTADELRQPGKCPYGTCNPSNPLAPLPCPGSIVLENLEYDPDDFWRNVGYLLALFVLALGFGMLMLRRLLRIMN